MGVPGAEQSESAADAHQIMYYSPPAFHFNERLD